MSDRLKLPPERDFGFYQRRKHDAWRAVYPPVLEAFVADSHAHIHMLPDPAWELARCAANGVDFVCEICDPSEDGTHPFDELEEWKAGSQAYLDEKPENNEKAPTVRIAAGVHPHNAKLYNAEVERVLLAQLADSRTSALGEVGLDYHYDLSPRDVQRDVFRRQIRIAKEAGLPLALHLRGGDDPVNDNAHREAFGILAEEDALGPETLLHCCALPPDELTPWIEADCHIAYGGALTFKSADTAREGAKLVPEDRLLLETDAPYMTPEPMRGAACTPAHVVFTAAVLADVRGVAPGEERRRFLECVHANTLAFYRVS